MRVRAILILNVLLALVAPVWGQLPEDYDIPRKVLWCKATHIEHYRDNHGPRHRLEYIRAAGLYDRGYSTDLRIYLQAHAELLDATSSCWPLFDLGRFSTQAYTDLVHMGAYRLLRKPVPTDISDAYKQSHLDAEVAKEAYDTYSDEILAEGEYTYGGDMRPRKCTGREILKFVQTRKGTRTLRAADEAWDDYRANRPLAPRSLYYSYRERMWEETPICDGLFQHTQHSVALYHHLMLAHIYRQFGKPEPLDLSKAIRVYVNRLDTINDWLEVAIDVARINVCTGLKLEEKRKLGCR